MGKKDKHKDRRVEESDEEEECVVMEKDVVCSQNCENEASKGESGGISFDRVNRAIEKVAKCWEQQNGPGVKIHGSGGEKDCDAAEG